MKKLRFYIIPLLVLAMLLVLPPTARAEAPTTTVMMYMCGTDLQSACVEDMYEMASVDLPDEVTVAVQAGGAYTWDDEDLTGEAINRFTITYGTFNDLEVLPWQSMADKETLTDFVAGLWTPTLPTATFWCCGITAAAPPVCALTKPPTTTV